MSVYTESSNMDIWFTRDGYDTVTEGGPNQEGQSPLASFVAFDVLDEQSQRELDEDALDALDAMNDYRRHGLAGTASYVKYRDERLAGGA